MRSTKYIGLDVQRESISIAVMNSPGKLVMECVIEAKASAILQFVDGLRGDLQVTFEGDARFQQVRTTRQPRFLQGRGVRSAPQCLVERRQQ
jgi:hypothetical protein